MSVEYFQAHNLYMACHEVLAQYKSVLLRDSQVLKLVCEDLGISELYSELLNAAQNGHILLRVRPALSRCWTNTTSIRFDCQAPKTERLTQKKLNTLVNSSTQCSTASSPSLFLLCAGKNMTNVILIS